MLKIKQAIGLASKLSVAKSLNSLSIVRFLHSRIPIKKQPNLKTNHIITLSLPQKIKKKVKFRSFLKYPSVAITDHIED
ncbi:hypothetical protein C7B67_23895 [filamentous cyanobacterium Phorm 6]|nr:hypothetical protein C7B67_23895 [filamentous cyanobacterium Phorm 6]